MSGDLPKGWVEVDLPVVADLVMGQSPPSNTYNTDGEGLPFFQGKTEFGDIYPTPAKYCSKPLKIAEPNDILISVRAPVGPTNVCREKSCIGRGLAAIRPLSDIPSRYLLYFLRSIEDWLSLQGTGSTFTAISKTDLEKLSIRLAPANEQRRIVAKLEKLLGKVDACHKRLERIPLILKRYRQSVLAAACSGRLTQDWSENAHSEDDADDLLRRIAKKRTEWLKTQALGGNNEARRMQKKLEAHSIDKLDTAELPTGWIWTSLLNACWLVVDCHNKTAPYQEHGIPLVRTTNIKAGKLLLEEVKFVSNETYLYWSRRCLPEPNDILFTREAPMGECAIIPSNTKVCMGQRLMLLRVFQELLSSTYVMCAIRDPRFQKRLEENSVGSGVKHLRVGDVERLIIPLPPLAEQQEIVKGVEALFKYADQIEARYRKAKAHVDKLTQSILAKAFCGELVPQDLNDEPAEVLLGRIRMEHDQTESICAGPKRGFKRRKPNVTE